jgi:hypothetical protein
MTAEQERAAVVADLIARLEAAGPEMQRDVLGDAWDCIARTNGHDWASANAGKFCRLIDAEAYVDAALMLVPEGCFVGFLMDGEKDGWIACCQPAGPDLEPPTLRWSNAATPALAIAVAALKATDTPPQQP